jgi:neutral ceramidase
MYEVGTGKADITAFKKDVGMMGYGMFHNRIVGIETPLYARAFVIRDLTTKRKIAFVNAEIAFITISIKRGVMKKLKRHHADLEFEPDNVFLTAQHTHSGPGGYSHYGLYNIAVPGFVPEVYQTIVDGIVSAIVEADGKMRPAKINFTKGSFAPNVDVAINRSVKAYNQNPEVTKISEKDAHLAVDREMHLFRVDGIDGKPIGSFNFFGVHTTSIHNNNTKINADNKGYASAFLEAEMKKQNPDYISVFAQKATGDVTPNYVWDKKKKWTRGKFEDDIESAKYNGKLQFEKAKELNDLAEEKGEPIALGIDYALSHANFANIAPDLEFTNNPSAKTFLSCHGVAFFQGTTEGPGMAPILVAVASFATVVVKVYDYIRAMFVSKSERLKIHEKYRIQGPKKILIETGDRKILGTRNVTGFIVPAFIDPTIKYFKVFHKSGGLDHKPWTPQTLPLQIVTLGQVAFVAIPGEITTIAAKRLHQTVLNTLTERGIKEVVLSSYANAYCGYITTFEEYQVQCYEGGHTPYGQWTLAAFQTKFKELAQQLLKNPEDRQIDASIAPVEFTEEELNKRTFAYSSKK